MYEVLRESITSATRFEDLIALTKELVPLDILQTLLLKSLDVVKENKDTKPSIRSVYLKSSSFHEVFPEAIQFKVTSFLNETEMFQSLPCVSHSFRQLFSNYPLLFNEVLNPFHFPPTLHTHHPPPTKNI